MRIPFASTTPVDQAATLLKKQLASDFPELSLNRLRDLVAVTYGYESYTALQHNLDPTAAPALGAHRVDPEEAPEQTLEAQLEGMLEMAFKVDYEQVYRSVDSALAATRMARASAGETPGDGAASTDS